MTNRIRRARNERDKGFTLIELLVVVIIIGILAAIAIPVFLNQRKKGVDASLKSDLKNAATVIETWNTDNPSTAVPVGTVPAGATPVAGESAALLGFKQSPGNTVKIKTGAVGVYTICAYNTGASAATSTTAGMFYDSATGGIVTSPATAAC